MKMITLLSVLASLSLAPSMAKAADCAYCGEMKKVMSQLKKTTDDPFEDNSKLVDRSVDLLGKILESFKTSGSDEDLMKFCEVMEKVTKIDPPNVAGEEMVEALGDHADEFFERVRKLKDSKKISAARAEATITSIAMAEDVRKNGTGIEKK